MPNNSTLCTAAATTVFLAAFCAAAVGLGTTAVLAMYTTLYSSVLDDEELRDLELILVGLVLGSVANAGVAVLSAVLGSHYQSNEFNQADMVVAQEADTNQKSSSCWGRLTSFWSSSTTEAKDSVTDASSSALQLV